MPGFYDTFGPPPDPFADAPDPATLQWPWSQPPPEPPVDLQPPPGAEALGGLPAPTPLAAMQAPPPPDLAGLQLPPELGPPGAIAPPPEATPPPAPLPAVPDLAGVGPTPPPAVLPSTTAAQEQDALNQRALTDQAGFVEDAVRAREDKAAFVARRRREMAEADVAAAKQHADDWKAADAATQIKMDAVLADAQRINDTKVDPSGGVHGVRLLGGVIASIIGGLHQARHGGRNVGMDALNEAINAGIDAQKADIANQREGVNLRKSVLAQEFARHGDMFRAEEAVRLAALQHADDILASEQQNYDQRGTTARAIAGERAQVAAAKATAMQAARQKDFENGLKLQDAARQQQLADIEAGKLGVERGKLALERGKAKADAQVWTPDQLEILNPGLPKPRIPMSQADYTKWLGAQKEGQQALSAARANDPNERNRELAVGGIVDSKGDAVKFRDVKTAGDVAQAKEDADELVRLTDEMVGMIKKSGWSSDLVKSDAWRKARSNYGSIIIRKKEQDKLGVLTGPDVDLVTKEIGTEDPTEARSPLAGLEQFRHNIIEGFNAKTRAQAFLPEGRTVARWEPKAPPTETAPADQLTGRTAIEQGQDATPGALASTLFTPFGVDRGSILDPVGRAEESARVGPTGLAIEDDAKVLGAIKSASKAAPAERAAMVDKLAAWAQSPRESVASGVLGRIRSESPALYDEIVAKLPEAQRDALPDFSKLPFANLPAPKGAK